jgi:uncharacterized membrane protein HdeD (DUF308 family)
MNHAAPRCPTCQGPLIRRNPVLLFIVGILFCVSPLLAFFVSLFWIPGIILFLTGAYLIAWAVVAKGMWCRQCKTMSPSSPG